MEDDQCPKYNFPLSNRNAWLGTRGDLSARNARCLRNRSGPSAHVRNLLAISGTCRSQNTGRPCEHCRSSRRAGALLVCVECRVRRSSSILPPSQIREFIGSVPRVRIYLQFTYQHNYDSAPICAPLVFFQPHTSFTAKVSFSTTSPTCSSDMMNGGAKRT